MPKNCGPGYESPQDAYKNGPREKLLYVTCARFNSELPDVLATVDVDPSSPHYSKVLHKLHLLHFGDEIHHSGWNTCSSCFGSQTCARRRYLVLPCLNSSRIYIVDTGEIPTAPTIFKVVEPTELSSLNLSFPHTSHCLADETVMISTLGDASGHGLGNFVLLDGKHFNVLGKWSKEFSPKFNYDFSYSPRHNVMISTEWGSPAIIKRGFSLEDVAAGNYGSSLHIWDWTTRKHLKAVDLGSEGAIPLEVRFCHDPDSHHGYVGCALGSSLFHFYKDQANEWMTEMVYKIPTKPAKDWLQSEMPALVTDIIISMDDRFLYLSCWLHGEIHQLDIRDPFTPFLHGKIFLGGNPYLLNPPTQRDSQQIDGGPQMLQLSLDGKRLYVTTSLYSAWDNQFYPDMIKNGSDMFQVDISEDDDQMVFNSSFRVNFGSIDSEPLLAHEMRYPGGDCTSDIWT